MGIGVDDLVDGRYRIIQELGHGGMTTRRSESSGMSRRTAQ